MPPRWGPVTLPRTPAVRHGAEMDESPPAVSNPHEPAGTAARPVRSLRGAVRAGLVNPVVLRLLRSRAHRLLSGSVLLLEYTGRRSGIPHELPAMFAPAGDRLIVIAGRPRTKTWWHNFGTDAQEVVATVSGRRRRCQAWRPDPATGLYRRALDAYRQRFPRVPVEDGTPVIVLVPDASSSRPAGSA
jgi:F420H(2)-dependent quinone reductase